MKKGLGKGLGAIMGFTDEDLSAKNRDTNDIGKYHAGSEKYVSHETLKIQISMIEPRADQPRAKADETGLRELADSIKLHGVLQPVLLRKNGLMYEIIAGERRWLAARMAGLKEIPAIVRDLSDKEVAEVSLIENIQREDLNSVEEAKAYQALIKDYGMTQEELAQRLSKSRSAITNSLRLLKLDESILKLLEEGHLDAGHARALLSINEKQSQLKAAKEVVDRSLSVRDTEKLAKKINEKAKINEPPQDDQNPGAGNNESVYKMYLNDLSRQLSGSMNTKVSIKNTGDHKGCIIIEYYSDEELNDLAQRLL